MLWSRIHDRATDWLWSRCVPIGWRDHWRHSTTLGYESRILWSLLTFSYHHEFVVRTPIDHDVTENNVFLHSTCCNNVFSLGLTNKITFSFKICETITWFDVISLAAIDGQHRRTCSLYRLFLLAAVIIDNLKRRSWIHDHRHCEPNINWVPKLCKYELRKQFCVNRVVKLWNMLPDEGLLTIPHRTSPRGSIPHCSVPCRMFQRRRRRRGWNVQFVPFMFINRVMFLGIV